MKKLLLVTLISGFIFSLASFGAEEPCEAKVDGDRVAGKEYSCSQADVTNGTDGCTSVGQKVTSGSNIDGGN